MTPKILEIFLPEEIAGEITKMLIGYALYMPSEEKDHDEKGLSTIFFLEQAIPADPGAFALYFKLLEKFLNHKVHSIPEQFKPFIKIRLAEIEEIYGRQLPTKYRPLVLKTI